MTDEELRRAYARATSRREAERARCPGPEALLAAVRRDGPERQRLETLDHAMQCAACRREVELLRAIEVSRRADAGESVRRIRIQRPLAIALAASLLLAVAIGPARRWLGDPADVTRDAPGGAEVAVLLPADEAAAEASAPLVFSWRPVPGASGYVVDVLTPQGAVRASVAAADTSATLAAGALAPGEYRWLVRAATPGGERRSAVRHLFVRGEPDA